MNSLRSALCVFLVACFSSLLPVSTHAASVPFANYVTRSNDKLFDGPNELRFVSTNMPDVLQIITDTGFDRTTSLRLPDSYELQDAVLTVKQMGGQVMRTFTITTQNGPSANHMFNVAASPVVPNEAALQVLDKLLQLCNQEGVRLYIPLIAYSNSNRGDPDTYGSGFWTVGSPDNMKFKDMIGQLLNRVNVFTGVQYKNDKAILGWESGNELVIGSDVGRRTWLHDIASYLKSIDSHHLFIDGRNRPDDVYNNYDEFFADGNIDVVCYHTYVNLPQFNTPASTLRAIRQYTAGRKPLIVGEIAMYTTESALAALLAEQIADGTSGSNWWGHRFRNREGGFFRHSDNGSLFEDLNWPGFPELGGYLPDIQKSANLQDILSSRAFQIQGFTRPPLPVPTAPILLSIPDVGHISWEGPTGAQFYDVARAPSASGPWTIVRSGVPDSLVIADSLFCDDTAEGAATYYYRIIAKNSSGASVPSNVVGPVTVATNWLIDDLFDLSRTYSATNVAIDKAYNHYDYSNDLAVLARSDPASPGSVVYEVNGFIRGITAYLHQSNSDPSFAASTDGITFTPLDATFLPFGSRKLFLATPPTGSTYRFARIALNTPTPSEAIGRVEIEYFQPAGTIQTPTFAPDGGTYPGAQSVIMATTTVGASIRYTTDGSLPTATTGTVYSTPVPVITGTTIRARAFKDGSPSSTIKSATYAINPTPTTTVMEAEALSPVGGGATATMESDAGASAGAWSKLASTSPGQYIEYTTPLIPAGSYEIRYRYKTGGSRAQFSFAIDGATLASSIDEYDPTSFYPTIVIGVQAFAASAPHTIRLTVVGKNAASTGYLLGSDTFVFAPVNLNIASPTFSPGSGTYTSAQSVEINSTSLDASIRYTTDGSTPTATTGTPYTGPIAVTANVTLKAIAYTANLIESPVNSASYVIEAPIPGLMEAEALSPVGVGNSVSVESDPPASNGQWSKFNGSAVGQYTEFTTTPLPAGSYEVSYRYKTGGTRAQLNLSLDGAPLGPTIDQYAPTSFYVTAVMGTKTFASPGSHTIRLTVAGHNASSTGYLIGSDAFIFAPVSTSTADTPAFSPVAGTYATAQTVVLSSATPGASIRYTLDGTAPSATDGIIYSGPIVINTNTIIKAIAYAGGTSDSPVSTAAYTIDPTPQPILMEAEDLSPIGVGGGVTVELDGPASAGKWSKFNGTAVGQYTEFTTTPLPSGTYEVRYRYKTGGRAQHTLMIDGSPLGGIIDPYAATSFYLTVSAGTVTFANSETHKIRLVISGKNPASGGYLIGSDAFTFVPLAQVNAPSPDIGEGNYNSPQTITLGTATVGASIRYTLDGSTPSATNGIIYSGPISLKTISVLKAIAFKTGLADSAVTTANYRIVDNTPPAISVPADIELEATGLDGAVANFSVNALDDFDGEIPVSSSNPPGSSFPLGTTTVRLHATDAAGNTASATFTVKVSDTIPPVISTLRASPNSIWPPNKKMVPVTLSASATDAVGVVRLEIQSVTCNENIPPGAWHKTGPLTLKLLADRNARGTGRVYAIVVEARDATGNSTTRTVTVTVPHDKSKNDRHEEPSCPEPKKLPQKPGS